MLAFIGKFIKKPRNIFFTAILIIGLILIFSSLSKSSGNTIGGIAVARGTVEQIVNVTGKIKSADKINLAFDRSGKVTFIGAKVGDRVGAGRIIMKLDTSELDAQAMNASAGIQAAQARLDQVSKSARGEEVNLAQANLNNSLQLQVEAKKNVIDAMRSALDTAINSLVAFTDIQKEYFANSFSDSVVLMDMKEKVIYAIYGEHNLGRTDAWYFLALKGGLEGRLNGLGADAGDSTISQYVSESKSALLLVQDLLESALTYMSNLNSVTDADKTAVNSAKTGLLAQTSALNAQQQSIISANNAVSQARAQLSIKEVPGSLYDIQLAQSQLDQAKANLALIQAQIAKYYIRAPISGIITDVEGNVGEIAAPNKTAISILGNTPFYIEAFVPETDIVRIGVGDSANVILDAFGPDTLLFAKVTSINPAETVIEGVTTFKTRLQFVDKNQEILPGLTAEIDIIADKKDNVLYAPTRSITIRGSKRYIKLIRGEDGKTQETEVTVGLKGTDGRTEIVSGLNEGQIIAPR
ncbi:MAG: HlyD family secretion protein [Parcubacteria group bacterium Licking1014_17]|nr:MAG: HlyD family secretion protein [Parcubacteria group bacterium Licking1014_17]